MRLMGYSRQVRSQSSFQTCEGLKSKHVKMVLLGASFDPQQKQIDVKSPLTCLDGLHGCFREGARGF